MTENYIDENIQKINTGKNIIYLTTRITAAAAAALPVTKSVTWQYLGSQAWYQRSASVKTTPKMRKLIKTLPEAQRTQGIESKT